MGEFQDTLVQFKQKLIDAGNGNHSITSLNSIAKELEVLITHLRDTANTSINRNFLFAGSNVTERPIDDNLEYHGNQDTLNILLGRSESQSGYNINGYDLFYGKDSDYSRVISSNIKHYNKTLLNPDMRHVLSFCSNILPDMRHLLSFRSNSLLDMRTGESVEYNILS